MTPGADLPRLPSKRPITQLADVDFTQLTPASLTTLREVAIPMAREGLTAEEFADELGFDRKLVRARLSQLADEMVQASIAAGR